MVDNGRAFWMGRRKFFMYDGSVRAIPCDVSDHVFGDMNVLQSSRFRAVAIAEHNTVRWHYCSRASSHPDRYVEYNYAEGHWSIGKLPRTAGVDRGTFEYPIYADHNGYVYYHERGDRYEDGDGTDYEPFVESAPFEIGNGSSTMFIRELVPDEQMLGDVSMRLYTRLYPTAEETEYGPFALGNPTTFRATGRQARIRVAQQRPKWRLGTIRMDLVPAGAR